MLLTSSNTQIERRLQSLERHLKQENPVLLRVVQSFRELDRIAYRMGILNPDQSFATRVPWWPLIALLGTFSSGKSTFINGLIKQKLQRTGNQAVDDKFTVICYTKENTVHTLPGLALDADPRFPFYQISRDIDAVVEGEGRRIDAYLQLKTCANEQLRGKILIDSPGFDADAQRTSTLRITDHIIDLSDLVLVFFDARHPEPGAMRDTLDHLVANTINRHDSNKFLFILNQIDATAQEDNLEEVVGAWQRALSQSGLTAGRFYQIYNLDAAIPIKDDIIRQRYESKRQEDFEEIMERLRRVEVERAYRIIGVLEHTARAIEDELVPKLISLLQQWRKTTLILDGALFGTLGAVTLWAIFATSWNPALPDFTNLNWLQIALLALSATGLLAVHFLARILATKWVARGVKKLPGSEISDYVKLAFAKNTSHWRSIFGKEPVGWSSRTQRRVRAVLKDTDMYVQDLNDQFTNPSGKPGARNPKIQLEIDKPA